jgi:hypothetical protein
MKNLAKDVGLCVNCKHIKDCISQNIYSRTVQFCELHETYEPKVYAVNYVKSNNNGAKTPSDLKYSKGLCANCELVTECTIEKPEDGIWHCEEYV